MYDPLAPAQGRWAEGLPGRAVGFNGRVLGLRGIMAGLPVKVAGLPPCMAGWWASLAKQRSLPDRVWGSLKEMTLFSFKISISSRATFARQNNVGVETRWEWATPLCSSDPVPGERSSPVGLAGWPGPDKHLPHGESEEEEGGSAQLFWVTRSVDRR